MVMTQRVFSYGTLRQPDVQVALFGREVTTLPDTLAGWRLDWLTITDPDVIATSGSDSHPILRRGTPTDSVDGAVLVIEDGELVAVDDYEVADYTRIEVALTSGVLAWVYVAVESTSISHLGTGAPARAREAVMDDVARRLGEHELGHPLRVGIDGSVGAGKSTFARELVEALRMRGRPAIHLDSDGFHNVRAIRYRRGRDSARGYYEDAYDFDSLVERVLGPLGSGGPHVFATKVHDLELDERVVDSIALAEPNSIVIFDCTFLQRGALRDQWDQVIYLDADRGTALRRGVARDAQDLGGEAPATAAYEARYMAACDIYLTEERPIERASIVIEHTDPSNPRVVRP